MTNIHRIDEWVPITADEELTTQISGQHPGGREFVAGRRRSTLSNASTRSLDAEGDGGNQNHTKKLEAGEYMAHRRNRNAEAEICHCVQPTP